MKLKKMNNFASVYENLKSTSKWKAQSLPNANHNYEEKAIHNWLNDCFIGWFLLRYIYWKTCFVGNAFTCTAQFLPELKINKKVLIILFRDSA